MKIGYARISTSEQNIDLQMDALKKEGCESIYQDIGISGSKSERQGLADALKTVRSGDSLIVWKLDRAFRSLKHMIDLTNLLKEKGVEFKSIQDSIDTSTPGGRLVFHIMASIAEFERDLIRERTVAGLASARARGRNGGRPKKYNDTMFQSIIMLYNSKTVPVEAICSTYKMTKTTFYRRLKQYNKEKFHLKNINELLDHKYVNKDVFYYSKENKAAFTKKYIFENPESIIAKALLINKQIEIYKAEQEVISPMLVEEITRLLNKK